MNEFNFYERRRKSLLYQFYTSSGKFSQKSGVFTGFYKKYLCDIYLIKECACDCRVKEEDCLPDKQIYQPSACR